MPVSVGQADIFQKLIEGGKDLTQTQSGMVQAAPGEQRPFLEAQFKLENEAHLTEMVGKLLKNDAGMAIMRNLA